MIILANDSKLKGTRKISITNKITISIIRCIPDPIETAKIKEIGLTGDDTSMFLNFDKLKFLISIGN